MKNTRIALVQMQSQLGMVEKNTDKILKYISRAAVDGVDIICFPEMSLQGYSRDRAKPTAVNIPGEITVLLGEAARRAGLTALVGLAEESGEEKPCITQLVVFPDGSWQKYRKTHLGKSELPNFTAGNHLPVFKAEKAVFGVEICWDLHFPEVTTVLSLKGAEIVFAPHASPVIVGDRRGIWMKYMAARAYDNSVFVAACNLVGSDGAGSQFCGGALVIDPKGNPLAESFDGAEGMLVADLDAGLINTVRMKRSKSMRDSFFLDSRRPDLYGPLVVKS
ncbi:MAG: nitrilase [Peptococcaceae bacterium BICA1-7]|nr:MAG: nitrilase [Peptococcaceae bacterium BICA1-7]HBV99308.1 nitrilase [Desulfotomaculum sp.]